MGVNPKTGIIEKKVLIQASPSVIYRALTDARELTQWFCDRVTVDPKVGGELKAYWRMGHDGQAQRGRALFANLVPDTQVDLHWLEEGGRKLADGEHHVIGYMIRLRRGTSEVTLRDEGPPFEDEEAFELLDRGWIVVLRDLKEHCEARQRTSRRRPSQQ